MAETINQETDQNWIPASQAYDMLSAHLSNPDQAGRALAALLRRGKLQSRARAIGESAKKKVSDARADVPRLPGKKRVPVPRQLWRSDIRFDEDVTIWRWEKSYLFVTVSTSPFRRRVFRGVDFLLGDLISELPAAFDHRPVTTPKSKFNRRDCIWSLVLEWKHKGPDNLHKNADELAELLKAELDARYADELRTLPKKEQQFGGDQCLAVARKTLKVLRGEPVPLLPG